MVFLLTINGLEPTFWVLFISQKVIMTDDDTPRTSNDTYNGGKDIRFFLPGRIPILHDKTYAWFINIMAFDVWNYMLGYEW